MLCPSDCDALIRINRAGGRQQDEFQGRAALEMVAVAQPMGDAVQAPPHGVRYRVLERNRLGAVHLLELIEEHDRRPTVFDGTPVRR